MLSLQQYQAHCQHFFEANSLFHSESSLANVIANMSPTLFDAWQNTILEQYDQHSSNELEQLNVLIMQISDEQFDQMLDLYNQYVRIHIDIWNETLNQYDCYRNKISQLKALHAR